MIKTVVNYNLCKYEWEPHEIEYLKMNYYLKSVKELTKYLGISQITLDKKVKELGIPMKGRDKRNIPYEIRRTTKVNDDFFSVPGLKNSYWAGFLAADGCITSDHKRVGLQIAQLDIEHVKNFIKTVGFDGKLSVYTRKNGTKMCNVSINSLQICNDLEKNFSIVPKKSLILKPPRNLTNEQKDAFIAGYIDGDGCIGLDVRYSRKTLRLSVRGTKEMNEFIRNRFKEILEPHKSEFGYRFKFGGMTTERQDREQNKNHCKYDLYGIAFCKIVESYQKYNLPWLERKWGKIGQIGVLENR
ncbi:MAG: hypothetical protein AAB907_02550 [Patescibacteria group bacterium]